MFNTLLLDATICTNCMAWWWWSLGAFLLGALLHWLLFYRKKQARIDELEAEVEGLHAQVTNMEKDYMSLKYQYDEALKDITALKSSLSKCESDKMVLDGKLSRALEAGTDDNSGIARGIVGAVPVGDTKSRDVDSGIDYVALLGSDNLQIVEGVGPKIDGLLKAAGMTDWATLGAASKEDIQKVLDEAGSRYRLADPTSWPRQAQLANEGKWDELIEYQKFLDTGVETKGDFETPSKVEKLISKKLGFSNNPNDLKIVEGIGPKIEGLLKEAGINNWSELAAATEDRLKEVLAAAGDRYRLADPSTWAKQAGLADAGKWGELKEYQDFLDGGKTPGK